MAGRIGPEPALLAVRAGAGVGKVLAFDLLLSRLVLRSTTLRSGSALQVLLGGGLLVRVDLVRELFSFLLLRSLVLVTLELFISGQLSMLSATLPVAVSPTEAVAHAIHLGVDT